MDSEADWLDFDSSKKFAQDNRMIMAKYSTGLSLVGQKLIRIAIANINSASDGDFCIYRCKLSGLAKLLEIDGSRHVYRDVRKAVREMLKTQISVESEKRNGSFRDYNLFSYCDYNDGTGTVSIKFNDDMREFLLQLKRNFTQIPLEQVLFMQHKYSIRIYELIKMKLMDGSKATVYAGKHRKIKTTVQEIRRVTGTEERYRQIGQLKEFVIIPAVRDIEDNAGLHCEFCDVREGKRIMGFDIDVWSANTWKIMQLNNGQIPGQITLFDDDAD